MVSKHSLQVGGYHFVSEYSLQKRRFLVPHKAKIGPAPGLNGAVRAAFCVSLGVHAPHVFFALNKRAKN